MSLGKVIVKVTGSFYLIYINPKRYVLIFGAAPVERARSDNYKLMNSESQVKLKTFR